MHEPVNHGQNMYMYVDGIRSFHEDRGFEAGHCFGCKLILLDT